AQNPSWVAGQYVDWFKHLAHSDQLLRDRHRTIDFLLDCLGYPLSPTAYSLLGVSAGLGVLALTLHEARRSTDVRQVLTRAFSLFSVWVLLVGPMTEAATYAFAGPVIACALLDAYERQSGWATRSLLIGSFLLTGPLCTDLVGQSVHQFVNHHGG